MNKEVKIKLNMAEEIKRFTQTVRSFSSDVKIVVDGGEMDAKSILGIYTVKLSDGVIVKIISDDEEEIDRFNKIMEEFR